MSSSPAPALDVPEGIDLPTFPPVRPHFPTIRYTVAYPSDPSSVPQARRYAVACAPDHPRPDAIGVAASELCGNACLYGTGSVFTLTVEVTSDDVVVTVKNRTSGTNPHHADPLDAWEHGRGFQLVSGMAELTVTVSAVIPNQWTYPEGDTHGV